MKFIKQLKRRALDIPEMKYVLFEGILANENGSKFEGFKFLNIYSGDTIKIGANFNELGLPEGFLIKDVDYFMSDTIISKQLMNKLNSMNNSEHLKDAARHKANVIFNKLFAFYKYGQKIISFKNEAIKQQMENTRVDKLCFKDFKVPLELSYLSIESKIKTDFIPHEQDIRNMDINISDIYIDGCFIVEYKNSIEFTVLFNRFGMEMDFLRVLLSKEDNVETAIQKALDSFDKFDKQQADKMKSNNLFKDEKRSEASQILNYSLRIAVNTILFFNAVDESDTTIMSIEKIDNTIAKDKNSKKNTKYSKKASFANYNYILSNKSDKNQKLNNEINSKRKIDKQFYVSGHYRKQPIGDKNNPEYKIIWIEPYIKGLDYKIEDKAKITII